MTVDVHTGRTKAYQGTELLPIVLGEKTGERIFLLLQVEGPASAADTLKEEATHMLTHAILEGEGEAYTRLEGALKELNGLIKGLLLSGAMKDVHALVGVLDKTGTLHLSHAGRAEAYLIRDGSAAQITEYSRGKPAPAFIHISTGKLENRDHVILSTQRLLRTITPAQLAQTVQRGGEILKDIISDLTGEKEMACLISISFTSSAQSSLLEDSHGKRSKTLGAAQQRRRGKQAGLLSKVSGSLPSMGKLPAMPSFSFLKKSGMSARASEQQEKLRGFIARFLADLKNPERKRRAHLLLLASAAGVFVILWMTVQLTLVSQKNQSEGELTKLIEQIDTDLKTAENRQLTGDMESANAILARAEESARKVMENENGLFRREALNLLDRIRLKQEEINHIVRIPPRVTANLTAKNPDVTAQGFLGLADGEFLVYDRQSMYRVLLNAVEDPDSIDNEELILDGANFSRFQSQVFITTGNSIIEIVNGQPTSMKTEDPAGWMSGVDIETYLRYAYILSPEKNQIYKYEHLANRYGPPAEYNVNGDLKGALDMTMDGDIYVLKEGGVVVKLLRGESKPFTIRNLPPDAIKGATRIFKPSATSNIYFLIPEENRIVVASNDTDLGESSYVRQYVLELDQLESIKDIFVDAEETRLYVLDEKRLYSIDLTTTP